MKYYLIAGEASGDLHASNLMKSLKEEDSNAEFRFFGGDKMKDVGGTLVKHYRELAYMGFIPVLLHARTILNNMKMCKEDIKTWRPDVVILVDYPGFNLDIAKFVHSEKIAKVFYYISPKIWAWKEYRIKNIRRDVDELFSILPFEVNWFKERGYKINYVGNPCVDAIKQFKNSDEDKLPISDKPIIAILSGSRKQEIKDNLSKMLLAASQFKEYELVLAGAPSIDRSLYDEYIPDGINVRIEFGKTYDILSQAKAALVTSGTATLETAIIGTPQVVCYSMKPARLFGFLRRFLKVKYVSLVNLVLNREGVTELIADKMTVENVKHELSLILPGGERREKMLADYAEMNKILGGPGASERAAKKMYELIKNE